MWWGRISLGGKDTERREKVKKKKRKRNGEWGALEVGRTGNIMKFFLINQYLFFTQFLNLFNLLYNMLPVATLSPPTPKEKKKTVVLVVFVSYEVLYSIRADIFGNIKYVPLGWELKLWCVPDTQWGVRDNQGSKY